MPKDIKSIAINLTMSSSDLQIIEILQKIGIENKGQKRTIKRRRLKIEAGVEAEVEATEREKTRRKRESIDRDQNNQDKRGIDKMRAETVNTRKV